MLKWLTNHAGWLLIVDNVDEEPSLQTVEQLFEHIDTGHILITSRLTPNKWREFGDPVELDVWEPKVAKQFLLTRTEKDRAETSPDEVEVKKLANDLGCLPLALEQAGACISELGISFGDYRLEWLKRSATVLNWPVKKYDKSIATTFLTSLDRLDGKARQCSKRFACLLRNLSPWG